MSATFVNFQPGRRFSEETQVWPPHNEVHLRPNGLFIFDFWADPCYHEILNAKNCSTALALAEAEGLRFLLYKIGELTWSDIPFEMVTLQSVPVNTEALAAHLVVVGAEDGVVRAVQHGDLETQFVHTLLLFAGEQARRGHLDEEILQQRLQKFFREFPTPEALLPYVLARATLQNPPVELEEETVDVSIRSCVM